MYETLNPKALCETLETDENNGLKDAEASHRLQRDGENILKKNKRPYHMGYDTGADQ